MNKEQLEFFVELNPNNELFVPIEGYEGYHVSSFGRVKNVITGKILKNRNRSGYYNVCLYNHGVQKVVDVHRLTCTAFRTNPEHKKCCDHIDRNRKNNHISNLRFATHQENCRNVSKKSTNSSGVVGVSWLKRDKKFVVRIRINGGRKCVGYFDDIETAARARKRAVKQYHGEFGNE